MSMQDADGGLTTVAGAAAPRGGWRGGVLLAALVLLAAGLRAWGLGYDLPYIYHPDEPSYVIISQRIFHSGDLNPHWFHFSSLLFYLNALAYLPFYLAGHLSGAFATPADILPPVQLAMGVTRAPMPAVVLLARSVTLLASLATVLLAVATGRRWSGQARVGLLAGLLVALSPAAVKYSRLVTPDALVTLFVLAAAWASLRLLREARLRDYALAGLFVGLAASSKYNGALACVSVLAAHLLRGPGAWRDWRIAFAGACAVAGFLATTPYALLDAGNFRDGVGFEFKHYAGGHPGMEGHALAWYLGYLALNGGAMLVLAALALARGWRTRSREALVLAAFPVLYIGFVSCFAVRNDRTLLPALPALAVLASGGAWMAWDGLVARWPGRLARASAAVALALALLLPPALATFADARIVSRVDSREVARTWIEANVPAGAHVAIESYSPFVDPARYRLQVFGRMIEHDPGWYRQQGFDYLVFSQGMYGRFLEDPQRYPTESAAYRAFFDQLPAARIVADPEHAVRVYRLR